VIATLLTVALVVFTLVFVAGAVWIDAAPDDDE